MTVWRPPAAMWAFSGGGISVMLIAEAISPAKPDLEWVRLVLTAFYGLVMGAAIMGEARWRRYRSVS